MIYARTMESGMDLQPSMLIVPRNRAFVGTGPDNKPGLQWTTKYGFVGPNIHDQSWVCDGINEKGLAVGNFLFPEPPAIRRLTGRTPTARWLRTRSPRTCSARAPTSRKRSRPSRTWRVGKTNTEPHNFLGNWHYAIYDAAGHSALVEYSDGQMNVQENPQGLVTNSPAFYWNLNGLRNYIQTASPADAADQCVWQAFHLLNQFDVPVGMIAPTTRGSGRVDYTNWTTAADMTHLRYYFHTYQNRQVKMVDLNKVDLNAKDVRTIPIQQGEVIDNVSGTIN